MYIQMTRSNRRWRYAGPFVAWQGKNQRYPTANTINALPDLTFGGQIDQDWHEVEIRVVGNRTRILFDGVELFDGRDERAPLGGFSITALWDAREKVEYIDIDEVVAWQIDHIDENPFVPMLAAYAEQPPIIDGQLDDNAWRQAHALGAVRDQWVTQGYGTKDQPLQYSRHAYLAYDDHALYIAMVAKADPLKLRIADNGNAYLSDGLEVHLQADEHRYLQIGIDIADNFSPGRLNTIGDTAAIKHTAAYRDDGWATELAIPWSLLGIEGPSDLTPDQPLQINLAANKAYQGNDEWTAVTATEGIYSLNRGGPSLVLLPTAAPTVRAVQIDEAPTLDGQLDEPYWQADTPAWTAPIWQTRDSKPAQRQRRIATAYDDEHLYIAMRADIPEGQTVMSNHSDVMFGDTLRIDFKDQAIGVDAKGKSLPILLPYQIPSAAGSQMADSTWTLEVAIPWGHLGGKPNPDQTLPISFSGHDTFDGPITWLNLRNNRDLERFGQLRIHESN